MKKRFSALAFLFLFLASCGFDTSSKPDVTITINEIVCFDSDRGVRVITSGPETVSRVWCQGGERRGVGEAYDDPIVVTILGDSFCLVTDDKILIGLEIGDKDTITEWKSSFCYVSETISVPGSDQSESY